MWRYIFVLVWFEVSLQLLALNFGESCNLLVFHRKDLCEAKHDLGVRKMCSKSTLYSHYATLLGGVKCSVVRAKHSIWVKRSIVRAKHSIVRAKHAYG